MLSMEKTLLTTAFTLGLICTAGISTSANAQDTAVQTDVQVQTQANADITPAQMEEFAEAEASVRELHLELQQEAKAVETQEEAQAFKIKVNNETVAAIQETGMSVEEYKQIALTLQANPELKQKYLTKYR